jgi:cytochrome o ubiquinol oxidase operon protein cyoD
MSRANEVVVSSHDAGRGTTLSYTIGFGLSLILTLSAYLIIDNHVATHTFRMVSIICLAIAQLFVQLICFLHLGRESKPRWNLTVLIFAAMVVIIVVFGSLWIMHNLNYRMTPSQVQNYMHNQDGL